MALPSNSYAPAIAGVPVVGQTLRASHGDWTNTPTYAYQWLRAGASITGANASTHILVSADNGTDVSCRVTATNGSGSVTADTESLTIGDSASPTWVPAARQVWEPDTIFLYEPDIESQHFSPGVDGLIDSSGQFDSDLTISNPFRAGSPFTLAQGKFRKGSYGAAAAVTMWHPGIALPSGSFTVEFWVNANVDWSTVTGKDLVLLAFGTPDPDLTVGSASLTLFADDGNSGKLTLKYQHRNTGTTVTKTIVDSTAHLSGEDIGIAVTYDGFNLKLFRTKSGTTTTVGTLPAVTPSSMWISTDRIQGFSIMPGKTGLGLASGWLISDIRVSRKSRTPASPVSVTSTNSVTISDTVTGKTVNQNLRGGVHYYGSNSAQIGNAVIESISGAAIKIGRTDKFLSAVPIKVGGTDASHTTLGHSGSYSYDWRPVDHTLDYYLRLGIRPYISIDSCPKILGGASNPFTPTQCANTSMLSGFSNFNSEVPNDTAAFATIASDLYYYITVTRGETPIAWSVWNEPDGAFWDGTANEYFQLYEAVSDAVRALDATVYLGAGEIADPINSYNAWMDGIISYCATNSVPLDFIGYHLYTGDLGYLKYFQQKITASIVAHSFIGTIDALVGEWGWQNAYLYLTGSQPFRTTANHWLNDWGAAFDAAALIEAQRSDVPVMAYYALSPAETSDAGYSATALQSATTPWAPQHPFNMWKRLG